MTTSSVEFFSQRIATAVACYGKLEGNSNLKESLVDPIGNASFTKTQADDFIAQYKLLNQLPNVPFNGFSATVFEDKTTGKHVIAMRGTEVPVFPDQTFLDLIKEDMLSIGGDGFANTNT